MPDTSLTPGQQLDANTDAIALLRAKVQSLAEQVAADGAAIASNTARIDALEAGNVPVEPPVVEPTPPPGEGFTDLGTPDYLLPPASTIGTLQAALDQYHHVAIPAGDTFTGSLTIQSDQTISVYGEGDRPVLNVPEGSHGITITAKFADVSIQGIAIHGPALPHLGSDRHGIHYKIGSTREGGLNLLIEDCEIARFRDLIYLVDDRSRTQDVPGVEGRITAAIRRNILHDACDSRNHSAGIYTEGVRWAKAEGNVTRRIGYTEDGSDPREKRSHGWYAQQYGGRIQSRGNWWIDCSANSIQARLGGEVRGDVAVRCSVGFVNGSAGSDSTYVGNLVIDQVDISPDEPRGDAFPVSGSCHIIKDNLAVRKLGSATNRTAYRDYWDAAEFSNNGSVGWVLGGDDSANWSMEEVPDDFPDFTDDLQTMLLARPRGVWGEQYETATFIKAARSAVGTQP